MSTRDALIDKLSGSLKPVRVKRLRLLAAQYFVTLLVLGGTCIGLLGTANGIQARLGRGDFLASLWVFVLSILLGSLLLAQYSRPGVLLLRRVPILFFSAVAAASLIQLFRFASGVGNTAWGPPVEQGWVCLVTALATGGVAATLLIFELRHEAPVKLGRAALFLLLSAGAMAALVLQIHCPNENPIHQMLWHLVLPLGVFAFTARTLSRLALRW